MGRSKLAVINFLRDVDPEVTEAHSFDTVSDCPLSSYLSLPDAGCGRVLIFELNQESLDVHKPSSPAAKIHSQIGAPKYLFEQHAQPGVRLSYNEDIIIPRPMAEPHDSNNFIGLYFDCQISNNAGLRAMPCPEAPAQPYIDMDSPDQLLCMETGRQIGNYEWQSPESDQGMVLIVPRKCTFWRRKDDNGAWLVLLIVDPSMSEATIGRDRIDFSTTKPLGGGYADLVPEEHRRETPSRESMFDDIVFYMRTYPDHMFPTRGPEDIILLLQKLILAHYGPLLGLIKHQVHGMRSRGWSSLGNDGFDAEARGVERAWSRFRITEYMQALKAVMHDLKIPLDSSPQNISPTLVGQLGQPEVDDIASRYQYTYAEMIYERNEYDRITTSIAALSGIMGSRQMLTEAQRSREEAIKIRTLTYIAMVFAPLSLIAAMFSMNSDYMPGGSLFKVYFWVAVPATVVVVALVMSAKYCLALEFRWDSRRLLRIRRRRNRVVDVEAVQLTSIQRETSHA